MWRLYPTPITTHLHHVMLVELNVNLDISGKIGLCLKVTDFFGIVYCFGIAKIREGRMTMTSRLVAVSSD